MAGVLFGRLKRILKAHYNSMKNISDVYSKFDFLIFTAKFNSLRNQTLERLLLPKAGIVPLSLNEEDRRRYGKKRILKYQLADEEKDSVKEFRDKVMEAEREKSDSGRTLFLVIADESHWGTVKAKEVEDGNLAAKKTQKAFNEFVNTWGKHKDVVVLQVSATPFNLLTINSRIPQVYYQDIGSKTRKEVHVVHWAELILEQFQKGCAVRLSTINGECCVGVQKGSNNVVASSVESLVYIDGSESVSGQNVRLSEYDEETNKGGRIFGLFAGTNLRSQMRDFDTDVIALGEDDGSSDYCFDFEAVLDSGMGVVS